MTVPFRIASFFSAYSIFRYLEIQTVFCLFFTVFILGTVIAYPILFSYPLEHGRMAATAVLDASVRIGRLLPALKARRFGR